MTGSFPAKRAAFPSLFGRSAGKNAAEKSRSVTLGRLTLDHVAKFEGLLEGAGIETDAISPQLLPTYTHKTRMIAI